MAKWFLGVLLVASAAQAEPWIDYDLVLSRNADLVVESVSEDGSVVRTIEFEDGVSVRCTDDTCVGVDRSQFGAPGCYVAVMAQLQAAIGRCDMPLPADTSALLDDLFFRAGTFVADNAVPATSWQVLRPELEAQSRQAISTLSCDQVLPENSVINVTLQGLLTPVAVASLNATLDTPRLPVLNPCF